MPSYGTDFLSLYLLTKLFRAGLGLLLLTIFNLVSKFRFENGSLRISL